MAVERQSIPRRAIVTAPVVLAAAALGGAAWRRGADDVPVAGAADAAYALALDAPDVIAMDAAGRVLSRAALDEAPTALAVSVPHARLVMAATGSNLAWSIDARDLDDARRAPLGFEPSLVAMSPAGDRVAMASLGEGVVALLDVTTLGAAAQAEGLVGAHDLRWDADGERLFVSTLDGARIVTLDGRGLARLAETTLPAPTGIDHMSRTPRGDLGIAVSPGDSVVRFLDLQGAPRLVDQVALPDPPARALVDERGASLWLASIAAPEIRHVPLASRVPEATPLPSPARLVAFEPFSDGVLVAGDRLTRLDAHGRTVEEAAAPAPLVSALPMVGAAATLMLDRDGLLWRQDARRPLGPVRLEAPPLYRVSGAHALAFCHA